MEEKQLPELYPGWKTVRKLGAGSFGTVYEIERDLFGRIEKAALKCITIPQNDSDVEEMYSNGYDDASITAHFENYLSNIVREYSLMAEMKGHTNVVYCDDIRYVPREEGVGWDITIKMELLTPLLRFLGPDFGEEQVVRLGSDICRALVLCRDRDIVHRDIKPQNIFVSKTGDYKLGDFGIAKTVERTTGGTKIGTYSYMAPEVYHSKPYGSGADIYSLGLVMYWLLNERRLPFLPLPPKSPTYDETETARHRRFIGEKLPEPKNGSEALKRIVLKACAFDPKERYASAQEMLEALNGLTTVQEELVPAPEEPAPPVRMESEDDRTMGLFFTLKSEPKSEPKPEPMPEPKPEPKIDLKIESKPKLKLEPKPEPKAEPKPEPKPEPATERRTQTQQQKKPIWLLCAGAVLLVGIVMFLCVHIWSEPTCEEPATCKLCGKISGDALGHFWTDATCTDPYRCIKCGESNGEPWGHRWEDGVCSRCGEKSLDTVSAPVVEIKWLSSSGIDNPQCSSDGVKARIDFQDWIGSDISSAQLTITNPYGHSSSFSMDDILIEREKQSITFQPTSGLPCAVYTIILEEGGVYAEFRLTYGYYGEIYLAKHKLDWYEHRFVNKANMYYLAKSGTELLTTTDKANATVFHIEQGPDISGTYFESDSSYFLRSNDGIPFTPRVYCVLGGETFLAFNNQNSYLATDASGNLYVTSTIDEECYWWVD